MYKSVKKNVSFPALEERILEFWEEREVFRKTDEQRQGNPEFVFYDGPPGTNGVPHIGHMMQSALKDLWPSYKTMQGYHNPEHLEHPSKGHIHEYRRGRYKYFRRLSQEWGGWGYPANRENRTLSRRCCRRRYCVIFALFWDWDRLSGAM